MVDADYIKSRIDEVREAIGRTVTFYEPTNQACPRCTASGYVDTASNTTWDFTCPVCDGSYWIEGYTEHEVLARVHWVNDEHITATPGGKYFLGECSLGIDPSYLPVAQATQTDRGKVVVDNRELSILKILPVGAPTINRYRVVCKGDGDRPLD